ncbi:DUF4097 family beta strand repeat-containing protein [Nonomuraea sp. NPDC050328]|uniref:DUF4097 family beta strand repeat-containing protein n=1 Tax=Nonomuraea sp. NPDC050328 TaxID=3364361 RepID=UPI0037A3F241
MAGSLALAALLLTGCGLQSIAQPAHQATNKYEVTEKVARLALVSDSGEVVISETSGSSVKVVETLRWSSERPTTDHKVDGDALSMSYNCPAVMDNCSVDYKVEIPKGLKVEVQADSGDVKLLDLSGPVDAKLDSGDLTATGLSGPFQARVDSGDLTATGLTGKELNGEVDSGDISLEYAGAPDKVTLVAGSGNAKLTLPAGPYSVEAAADSGDVNVSVVDDPKAPRKIIARADSGDVTVASR